MVIKNRLPSHYCEISYMNEIIDYCSNYLDDNYAFYFIYEGLDCCPNGSSKIDYLKNSLNGYKKIAIHVGNEMWFDNQLYDAFDLIFRFYQPDKCDNQKIFNINIGYNSSGKEKIVFNNSKKLSERKKDVFFVGNPGQFRMDFFQEMQKFKFKYDIRFTNGFRQGLTIDEYINELSETKICLVPRGVSPETFRYTEAFASGCIVITTEKVNTWYYENSPAYFLNSWSELTEELITSILNSDIDSKQIENINYYEKYLSAKSISEYILKNIVAKFEKN